jgi:type I restriction enzyme S subunit
MTEDTILTDFAGDSDSVEGMLLPENVPDEWEVRRLGSLFNRVSNRLDPEQFDEHRYVSLKHIPENGARIREFETSEGVSSAKYEFEEGDILFGKLRPYFRKVALATFGGICSTDINVIQPAEKVHRDFLHYTLFRQDFIDFADKTSTGTRMPRADWDKLDDLLVAVPPYEEQKRIGEFLYAIDERRDTQREMNELIYDLLLTTFKDRFIHHGGAGESKNTEIGEVPADFEVKTLSEFVEIELGNSPKSEYYNEEEEGVAFFQGSNTFGSFYPTVEKWCTKPNKFAEEGDVLISIRAPVGDLNIATQRCCIGRGVTGLRMKEYENHFLFYLLEAKQKDWEKYKSGTTFNSINKSDIESFPVPYPPEDEIKEFNNRSSRYIVTQEFLEPVIW